MSQRASLETRYAIRPGNLLRFTVAGDAGLLGKLLRGLFHAHSVLRRPLIEERSAAARHNRTRHYAVDLDSILNALLGKGLRERDDGGVDGRYGREARLRIESGASGDEYDCAVRSLQSIPGSYRQPARTVQLQRQAVFPLRVRHLEQIDLRHGAGDVYQSVDSAKAVERALDEDLGRARLAQIERVSQGFGARGFYRSRGLRRVRPLASRPGQRLRNRAPGVSR